MNSVPPPAVPLAGRYRFTRSLPAGPRSVVWLAVDESMGRLVVLSALGKGRLESLAAAVGCEHAHLAPLTDVVTRLEVAAIPGGARVQAAGVGVASYVPGGTLHDQLKVRRLGAWDAVTWCARVAQALAVLHDAGAAHGALSPRALVIAPEGRPERPVLTQLEHPPNGAYCAPERVSGGPPTPEDDVWALHACLYAALTGHPPFEGKTKETLLAAMLGQRYARLAALGVGDERLDALLLAGLQPDLARRTTSAAALAESLQQWLRQAAFEAWTDDEPRTTGLTVESPPSSLPRFGEDDLLLGGSVLPGPEDDTRELVPREPLAPLPPLPAPPAWLRGGPPVPGETPGATAAAVATERTPGGTAPETDGGPAFPSGATPAGAAALAPPLPGAVIAGEPGSSSGPSAPAAPARPLPPAPRRPGSSVVVAAGGAVALAVGVAWWLTRSAEPVLAPAPGSARPAPAAASFSDARTEPVAPAPDRVGSSGEAQAAGATPAAAGEGAPGVAPTAAPGPPSPTDLHACVARSFGEGTFKGEERFEFLCADEDLRLLASRLSERIVVSGAGKITAGMREWSQLTWYQIAAVARIRERCCPGAEVKLPEAGGSCISIREAIRAAVKSPLPAAEAEARARGVEESILCHFRMGLPRPLPRTDRPTAANRNVLVTFLARTAD